MSFYSGVVKPVLFRCDPERIHHLSTRLAGTQAASVLLSGIGGSLPEETPEYLSQTIGGIEYKHPIGLAAGFDKNAELAGFARNLQFSYREVGSVTAEPASGNPRPRLFRLPKDRALINRMGLNNDGAETIARRIAGNNEHPAINIAKTPDPAISGDRAIRDYLQSYKTFHSSARYITLNISCPNTEEGKTFESPEPLEELLAALDTCRDRTHPPLLIKFSADHDETGLDSLLQVTESHSVDGYVCCNTSTRRTQLTTPRTKLEKIGIGGLSGRPLHYHSCRMLQFIRSRVPRERILIGVGGIDGFESAAAALAGGADLLQVYTGLIYEGPHLVKRIITPMLHLMKQQGLSSTEELRDYLTCIIHK